MGRMDGSVLRLELGSWAGDEGVQGLGRWHMWGSF